jgi:hypothetical protein
MRRHLVLGAALVGLTIGGQTSWAALMAVDINDRTVADATNTPPGFESWVMNASGTTATQTLASGYTLTFDIFDDLDPNDGGTAGNNPGAFDDRDRVVPTTAPTLNEVYDDFIFAGASAGPTGGLDMTITGGALLPNTQYLVSVYSYDGIDANMASATQVRTANWLDGNNSDALAFATSFTINMPPTTDDQYKFTGIALTDGTGKLFLKGRRTTAGDVSVYVDAVEVDVVPEPTSLILLIAGCGSAGIRRRR